MSFTGQPASSLPGSEQAPRRLDAAAAAAAGVSRRRAQRLLADGMVTLNGRVARASDKGRLIDSTDTVAVLPGVGNVVPEADRPLAVLAEGDGWVAVDKPAGQPVHPLRDGETGTLLNAAAARYPQLQGVGHTANEGGLRSGVVHRLDVETSGVLLLALDESRWQAFRSAFAQHQTRKTYVAVVAGRPPNVGRANVHLAVTRHRPARVEAVPPETATQLPGARRCRLSWRTTKRLPTATRLEVDLETGFLHQIRATLAHLGHSVLGDPIYGPHPSGPQASISHQPLVPRLMLHAGKLRLDDGVDVTCPPPPAFVEAVTALGTAGNAVG